jgi:hypothetical protein
LSLLAEHLFRRALVLCRASKPANAAERQTTSGALAEAAWFFCRYTGRDGNLHNLENFKRRIDLALRLDPRNAEALFMRAMSVWWARKSLAASVDYNGRIPARQLLLAEADLRLAVKVRPKFPEAWFGLWLLGMINGTSSPQQLVNTVRYARSADPFLDGNLPEALGVGVMISDARAFLKLCYPEIYKKEFGDQPAPKHVTLW